jgi:hypothetical protein
MEAVEDMHRYVDFGRPLEVAFLKPFAEQA